MQFKLVFCIWKSNNRLRVEVELQVKSDGGENVHEPTRVVSNWRGNHLGFGFFDLVEA
jgi:hypothetical protein